MRIVGSIGSGDSSTERGGESAKGSSESGLLLKGFHLDCSLGEGGDKIDESLAEFLELSKRD